MVAYPAQGSARITEVKALDTAPDIIRKLAGLGISYSEDHSRLTSKLADASVAIANVIEAAARDGSVSVYQASALLKEIHADLRRSL